MTNSAQGLIMRWLPVVDASGRTRMQAVWAVGREATPKTVTGTARSDLAEASADVHAA